MRDDPREQLHETAVALIDSRRPWSRCLRLFKIAMIEEVMDRSEGNVTRAAQILSIHRNTLQNWLRELPVRRGE